MSALNIKRGTVARPQRLVIYAPEGLGKSTLAGLIPNSLFLDFEKGTHHLNVARLEPSTLKETEDALKALAKDCQGFETIIIDTIDWLEELIIQAVCEEHSKKGLEDFGYGKGYVYLAERVNGILTLLNTCALKMNVILIAHCHSKKFELPDSAGAFDHYELKLSKQVGPLVREWCDALLFGNWKTKVREIGEGDQKTFKAVASSGRERILYCAHAAAWDAKNRHGLKEEEAWNIDTIKRCLGNAAPGAEPVTKEAPKAAPINATVTAKEDGIPGLPPANGGPPADHPLTVVVGEHAAAVNAYLVSRKIIQAGQTYLDVPADYITKVQKNAAGFMAQALKGTGVVA